MLIEQDAACHASNLPGVVNRSGSTQGSDAVSLRATRSGLGNKQSHSFSDISAYYSMAQHYNSSASRRGSGSSSIGQDDSNGYALRRMTQERSGLGHTLKLRTRASLSVQSRRKVGIAPCCDNGEDRTAAHDAFSDSESTPELVN